MELPCFWESFPQASNQSLLHLLNMHGHWSCMRLFKHFEWKWADLLFSKMMYEILEMRMSKKVWSPKNIRICKPLGQSLLQGHWPHSFLTPTRHNHKVCSCHMFWHRIDNLARTTYFPPSSQSWTPSWSSLHISWPRPKQSQTLPRKCQRWRNSSQIEWLATIGCSTIHVSVQTSCVSIQTSCSHCQKSMISNSLGNSWSFLSQVDFCSSTLSAHVSV